MHKQARLGILKSSWWQIFLHKLPKYFWTFWAILKNISLKWKLLWWLFRQLFKIIGLLFFLHLVTPYAIFMLSKIFSVEDISLFKNLLVESHSWSCSAMAGAIDCSTMNHFWADELCSKISDLFAPFLHLNLEKKNCVIELLQMTFFSGTDKIKIIDFLLLRS